MPLVHVTALAVHWYRHTAVDQKLGMSNTFCWICMRTLPDTPCGILGESRGRLRAKTVSDCSSGCSPTSSVPVFPPYPLYKLIAYAYSCHLWMHWRNRHSHPFLIYCLFLHLSLRRESDVRHKWSPTARRRQNGAFSFSPCRERWKCPRFERRWGHEVFRFYFLNYWSCWE